jgi:hypothetical protein
MSEVVAELDEEAGDLLGLLGGSTPDRAHLDEANVPRR